MTKTIIGIVSSAKADKTIVVTVQERKTHALYHKQYTVSKKFMAHDEKNEAQVGDKVEIIETRPISAQKHHSLNRIVEKPALREDSLLLTKTADTADKPSAKSKQDSPEKEES
jgi:small subunit ribosomal protein S17